MATSAAPIPWFTELHTLACRYADRSAVQDSGGTLTYAELDTRARAVAYELTAILAISKQASTATVSVSSPAKAKRVGVLMRNGRAAVVADYAVSIAGACIVHLNPAYSSADLEWCQRLAPFDLLITEEDLLPQTLGLTVRKWTMNSDGFLEHLGGRGHAVDAPPIPGDFPAADSSAEARIIFTSGTSGRPKAAVYSHAKRWVSATVLRSVLPYRPNAASGIVLMTPYVHGATSLARAYLECGSRVALLRGIDEALLRSLLFGRNFDALFAPPSVLAKLVEIFTGERLDHIRCIYTGTQPLPLTLYRKAAAIFGPCMRVTYGKTENLNPITVLEPDETDDVYQTSDASVGTCVGYPGPGVELRISRGGEVELRSQHQYCGYLTESGFQAHADDAWHATGDLGAFDSRGRLWLKGRSTEAINSGGYMVSPDDVEATVRTAESVSELCVLGLPSEYWTEVIVCVYVPRPGASTAAMDLEDAAKSLTKYKRPRLYVAVDAIPATPAGKVDRRAIRQWLLSTRVLIDGPYPTLIEAQKCQSNVGT